MGIGSVGGFDPMAALDMLNSQKQAGNMNAAGQIGLQNEGAGSAESKSAGGSNFMQQADAPPPPATTNQPVGDSLDATA